MNHRSRPKAAPESFGGDTYSIPQPTDIPQQMPDLSSEQHDALKADIEAHGVIVPVVVDQHGRLLDGHNRRAIATELGIDCPVEVHHVADDDAAADLAVTLNCARRHLTREQVRDLIRSEAARRPEDSDRAIARRVGCSPSTVAAARRPDVSNLDTSTQRAGVSREEAEARAEEIRETLCEFQESVRRLIDYGLCNAIPPADLVLALTRAQRAVTPPAGMDKQDGAAVVTMFRQIFDPLIDYAMSPKVYEYWRPQWDAAPEFEPLTVQEVDGLLDGIATLARRAANEGVTR